MDEDAVSEPDDAIRQFSEQADLSRRLLEGTTPEEAGQLLDRMPAEFLEKLEGISPRNHIDNFKGRLLVMHDIGDSLIPVGESRRLVETLRSQGRQDMRYTETEIFEHVRRRRRPATMAPAQGRQQALRPHVRRPPHRRLTLL